MNTVTQAEFQQHYERIYNHLCYITHPDRFNNDFIVELVRDHFTVFLNNYEKECIKQLIFQNYTDNYGYTTGIYLPNGNTIHWEIQIVVLSAKSQYNNEHMNKYYLQEYKDKFLDIIKSKKL